MLMPERDSLSPNRLGKDLKHPVQVIAVTSGKGGVGKTNISANLAVAMTSSGKKVMLLDADMGMANLDVMLGLRPQHNLSHVISGEKSLSEVIIEGPGGLKIIPAASGVKLMTELGPMQHAGLIHAFSELTDEIDVLLVDTAAGISGSVINFCRASQEVIVVVCDEPTSLVDAFALMKVLNRDHGVTRFQILSNMTHNSQEGRDLYTKLLNVTDKYLDLTAVYMGAVPYDDYLRKAVKKQRPVVSAYPRSRSSLAFKNLAQKADKWPVSDTPGGHLEFFVERLVGSGNKESEFRK